MEYVCLNEDGLPVHSRFVAGAAVQVKGPYGLRAGTIIERLFYMVRVQMDDTGQEEPHDIQEVWLSDPERCFPTPPAPGMV